MEPLLDLLRANRVIVYFVYGQVFFTLGIIIAFTSHRNSRLPLARHLKWLAAFGLVHGLTEWSHIFIPIQATYVSAETVTLLRDLHTLSLAVSFYLLFQFGILVAFPASSRRPWLYCCSVALPLAWLASGPVFYALGTQTSLLAGHLVPQTEVSTRVILGLTGGIMAAFGMFRQARSLGETGGPQIARYLYWTAIYMALYAFAAGLVLPTSVASVSELAGILALTDVPVFIAPVLRSLVGIGMTFSILRGLMIFELETEKALQEAERNRLRAAERAQFLKRVITAQEDERKRVARELHDETGQKLSAVIMGLAAASDSFTRGVPGGREIIKDTRVVAVEALDGIRQLILGLRPSALDDLGLAPALRRIAEELSKVSAMRIKVKAGNLDGGLTPEVEIVLFRILQEAMNNAVRHSGGHRTEVRLSRNGPEVAAVVEDDGTGFNPAAVITSMEDGCGLGLIGMQERASLLGGEVRIDSAPGRGTRLHVRLPILGKEAR